MPTGGCEVQAEQPSDPPAYPVRFKALLERAPRRLRWKVLPEVAQREDLDSILKDLVDDAIGVVEDFTDRGLMPFGNHTTLFREIPKQFHSAD